MSRPFFLQVDTSAYAMGAILTQKDDRGKHWAVGFLSKTFNEVERNYNIHDQELLAVFRGLTHWRHLLLSSPHVTTVLTDHKNLEYYCHDSAQKGVGLLLLSSFSLLVVPSPRTFRNVL